MGQSEASFCLYMRAWCCGFAMGADLVCCDEETRLGSSCTGRSRAGSGTRCREACASRPRCVEGSPGRL